MRSRWKIWKTPSSAPASQSQSPYARSPTFAQLISSSVTAALGEERAGELRTRGADMDWDQALAYTLTQTTQALSELRSQIPAISTLPLQAPTRTANATPGDGHSMKPSS